MKTITIKQSTFDYITEKLIEEYEQGYINQNTGEKQFNNELREVLEDLGIIVLMEYE